MIKLVDELPVHSLHLLEERITEQEACDDQIKFMMANVKIAIDSSNLQYEGDDHESFSRLGSDVHQRTGKLFLTSKFVVWFNEEAKLGIQFEYTDLVLHALLEQKSNAESNQSDDSTDLFVQVMAGEIGLPDGTKLFEQDFDQDDEEACLTWDFTLCIPCKEAAESIFKAITQCSASMCLDDLEDSRQIEDHHEPDEENDDLGKEEKSEDEKQ